MKKKQLQILIISMLVLTPTFLTVSGTQTPSSTITLHSDALIPPDIPIIKNTQFLGPDPGFYETSEYMIGTVAVGVIFLESNGAIDPDTETWTTAEETNVQNEITQGLNWWKSQNPNAGINFVYDWHFKVPTSYEPIIHPSGGTDNTYEKLWVSEAMAYLGYTSGDWFARTRSYINALRTSKGTDWAYAIYVVDSSNDADGCFSDGWCAYTYYGAFVVMTYDNDGWGISNMDRVTAHETGHIFWATDEYNGITEYSGYLNAADVEGSGCLMDNNNLCLSTGTQLQVGWRDTDYDGILDIVDTNPDTTLNPYTPDPTSNTTLTYTGSATVVPYPNNNPQPSNSGNSVTINKITKVEYRVDGGAWIGAIAVDGLFDEPVETFTFTTSSLSPGQHIIEARALNSVGNYDPTPASDTVTITTNTAPNTPSKPSGPTSGTVGETYTYTTSTTDPDGDNVRYGWDFDGDHIVENEHWTQFYASGATCSINVQFTGAGTYYISAMAEDVNGAQSGFSPTLVVNITGSNSNPNTPSQPSGPTSGTAGTAYTYTTSATDPDGDTVKYGWDWDGDDVVDEWTSFYASGATCSVSHIWATAGTYQIKVKAEDVNGAQSGWSNSLTVIISTGGNNPPDIPVRPSGETHGKAGVEYSYASMTTDPDGDSVYYLFDWGDGTDSGWLGPYNSGDPVTANHTWSSKGSYEIKVKAKDDQGAESDWSDPLAVSMPKTMLGQIKIIELLMQRFRLFTLLHLLR